MKPIVLFSLTAALLSIVCCRPFAEFFGYGLGIYNHSGIILQTYGTISDNTSLPFEYPLLEQVGPTTDFPDGILFSDDDWISTMSPNDTLRLFIFQDDIVDNYGWEKVHDDYMILVRYDLSKEDIQRLNTDIHYPPTEEMRDVHMYPPYEEVIANYNRIISEKE